MLRDPAIRRVAFAHFVSAAGAEAAFFVGIWGRAAYDFKATPAELAVLMGVLGLGGLAGAAIAGVLVDRYGPRRVAMVGEALFVPATLALVLPTSMLQLTLVVAAGAFFVFVVITAISAFPPFLVTEPQQLAKANAAVEIGETAASVCGPAIGALIATVGSLDWVFVLDAATSLVAVALIAGLAVQPAPRRADRERNALRELREGVRFAYGIPVLRFCLLLGAVVFMSFGAFAALEPLFFREVLDTGPQTIGWVNALFGAGLAAGSLLIHRRPSAFMSVRAATLLSLASGLGAVAYTGTANLWVVVVAAPAWGVILGVLFPALRTLMQLHTPDALLGRATGVLQVHQQIGELLPLVLVPGLAAAWGVQVVLVGSGALLVLVCALMVPLARGLDRQRSGEVPTKGGEPIGVR